MEVEVEYEHDGTRVVICQGEEVVVPSMEVMFNIYASIVERLIETGLHNHTRTETQDHKPMLSLSCMHVNLSLTIANLTRALSLFVYYL